MTMIESELVIIGAGPAGAGAALRARSLGLEVLLIDEGEAAGGQVYRAPRPAVRAQLPQDDPGERLRQRLATSGAVTKFRARLWHVEADGTMVITGPQGIERVRGQAVLVATGAVERFHPFDGWTTPGVVGLAAATAMIKAHGVLPGRRVLVAGPGPLAPLVAGLVRKGGGEVVALVDPLARDAWLKVAPALVRRPRLALQGAGWIGGLHLAGARIVHGARIEHVRQTADGLSVTVDDGRLHRFLVDAVCAGNGLEPASQVAGLLGAAMLYNAALGGWVPALDGDGRTSVPRLYAAGDGAGIRGAEAASCAGDIAAIAAAVDLARISAVRAAPLLARAHRRLAGAARFGTAMGRLMHPPDTALQAIAAETIVCRCEDIAAGTLRQAIRNGARSLAALKSATRCGMGPCGGRVCAEAATALIAASGIERAALPPATARSPLRPVGLSEIAGSFVYDDILFSEPSPA